MADGGVRIEVGLNISKAQKDLEKLKDKINKVEDQLNSDSAKKSGLEKQIEKTNTALMETKEKIDIIKGGIEALEPMAIVDTGKAQKELDKLMEKIEKTRAEIAEKEDMSRQNAINLYGSVDENGYERAGYKELAEKASARVAELEERLKSGGGRAEKAEVKAQLTEAKAVAKEYSKAAQDSEKEMDKLNEDIQKGKQLLSEMTAEAQKLEGAIAQSREAENAQETLKGHLAEATAEEKALTREAASLEKEHEKVSAAVDKGTQSLTTMKEEAGDMQRAIEGAKPGEAIANSLKKAEIGFKKVLKYAFGIRSVFILWRRLKSYITDAVKAYMEYDDEMKLSQATLKATGDAIKMALGSGFASIYAALLPTIQKIANWMLEAANAAARFIAILSGKSSYKKAVVDTDAIAAGLEDTADAADAATESAKELQRTLAPIDELNIINTSDSSGSASNAAKTASEAAKTVTYVEEAVDALDTSFIDKLAATIKDVFFDWSDLNPEQIAEKIIAGLNGVLMAALGATLKMGVGGILGMTLAGVAIGLIADSLIFDHDGKISETEAKDMIRLVVGGLLGAVTGLIISPSGSKLKGALIGFEVGAALTLMMRQLLFDHDGKLEKSEGLSMLLLAINGMTGAALGLVFAPWSLKGAAIGATIGVGLTLAIKWLTAKLSDDAKASNVLNVVKKAITALSGGIIGFGLGKMTTGTTVGGLVGAVIGATVSLSLTLMIDSIKAHLADQAKYDDTEFAKEIAGLREKIENSRSMSVDLQVKINSITGEVDENTMADLTAAQGLIDRIFELDAKETKTSWELSEIQRLIGLLNGMELPGVFLEFNNATQSVMGTHDAMTLVISDLLEQYKMQALGEAYMESFRTQYEAVSAMQDAEGRLKEARIENSKAVLQEMAAQIKYNQAQEEFNRLKNLPVKERGDTYWSDLEAAGERLEKANDALGIAKQSVSDSESLVAEAEVDMENKIALAEQAVAKVDEIEAAYSEAVQKSGEAGKNTAETFGQSIEDNSQGSVDAAIAQAKATLEEGYDDTLDIASPSGEAEKRGLFTTEGFKNGIEEGTPDVVDAAKQSAEQILEAYSEFSGDSSPFKDFGEAAMQSYRDGIESGGKNVLSAIQSVAKQSIDKVNSAGQEIVNIFSQTREALAEQLKQMRALMNFSWSIPKPKIPRISWSFSTVRYGNGQSVQVPQFYVNWYAKGGIFDFPQLIGVGENGKEAVVPLEKNTEWMNLVADGLMERLEKVNFANQLADAFMSLPKPAMASGGIVPPGAVQGNALSAEGIEDAIQKGIYNAMMAMGNSGSRSNGGFKININGREFMQAVYEDLKTVESEHGISLIQT